MNESEYQEMMDSERPKQPDVQLSYVPIEGERPKSWRTGVKVQGAPLYLPKSRIKEFKKVEDVNAEGTFFADIVIPYWLYEKNPVLDSYVTDEYEDGFENN